MNKVAQYYHIGQPVLVSYIGKVYAFSVLNVVIYYIDRRNR